MTELINREIRRKRCLLALFADDANTNIRRLDHADVVSAVADAANALPREASDQTCNIRLLCGGTTAGDDSRELGRNLDKLVLEEV